MGSNPLLSEWQINITKDEDWLNRHESVVIVYGDAPIERRNEKLSNFYPRNHLRTYSFIDRRRECPLSLNTTKLSKDRDYYFDVHSYEKIFYNEIRKLRQLVITEPDLIFYIDPIGQWTPSTRELGSYKLFPLVIAKKMPALLSDLKNVKFGWNIKNPPAAEYWAYVDTRDKVQVFEMIDGDELTPKKVKFLTDNNKTVRVVMPASVTAKDKDAARTYFEEYWQKHQYGTKD